MWEDVVKILAGVGVGWIASYFFAVRPAWYLIRDMRYAGFKHDAPVAAKIPTGPQPPTVNET